MSRKEKLISNFLRLNKNIQLKQKQEENCNNK
jgi:hypothetical protein